MRSSVTERSFPRRQRPGRVRHVHFARQLGFGLMAGSSLPVTWRRPEYEPERGTPFTEALVCYGN